MNLKNEPNEKQVVAITGASAGIGRATAIEFARRGWHVALLARGPDGLQGALRDVKSVGGKGLIVPIDVADQQQVEAAAARIVSEWGAIDVWVNNAMATVFCPAASIDPADFQRVTDVTYLGSVWGTLAALKHMRARNRGTIVQVGSALVYRSIPLQSAYCGAKSAIRGFIDSLRSELHHDRCDVRLTMVQLSAFNTPQFDWGRSCMPQQAKPMGAIFQPEIAARAIFWAATHPRRELWVGWPAIQAILGTRIIPGFLDRKLAYEAVSGQQTGQPAPAGRRDNLYSPVPGDHGAHGRFDATAVARSPALWCAIHKYACSAAAVALLVFGAWLIMFLLN